MIVTEVRLTKMKPTSFYKKQKLIKGQKKVSLVAGNADDEEIVHPSDRNFFLA